MINMQYKIHFLSIFFGELGTSNAGPLKVKGEYVNGRICLPFRTKLYPLRRDELFAVNAYTDF